MAAKTRDKVPGKREIQRKFHVRNWAKVKGLEGNLNEIFWEIQ